MVNKLVKENSKRMEMIKPRMPPIAEEGSQSSRVSLEDGGHQVPTDDEREHHPTSMEDAHMALESSDLDGSLPRADPVYPRGQAQSRHEVS